MDKITFGLLLRCNLILVLFLIATSCNKEEKEEVLFSPGSGVTDIDGNFYPSVILDNGQEWMAENFRSTRYCNGDTIDQEMDSSALISNTEGGWTWYDFNSSYNEPYGKLYNGFAVNNTAGLCPCGWHVPSNAEWDEMVNLLGGLEVAGSKMKVKDENIWDFNEDATNTSGFSAYPGGKFSFPISKNFRFLSSNAYWWSSTSDDAFSTWHYYITSGSEVSQLSKYTSGSNNFSYMSVRCIKD